MKAKNNQLGYSSLTSEPQQQTNLTLTNQNKLLEKDVSERKLESKFSLQKKSQLKNLMEQGNS